MLLRNRKGPVPGGMRVRRGEWQGPVGHGEVLGLKWDTLEDAEAGKEWDQI